LNCVAEGIRLRNGGHALKPMNADEFFVVVDRDRSRERAMQVAQAPKLPQ
jgi:hypothetical protein